MGRVISLEYAREVLGIKYGMESFVNNNAKYEAI